MKTTAEHWALLALFAGTFAVTAALDEGALSAWVLLLLTAIVTVGISLLMGHAGQVSLGQGAFYASGAYAAGLVATAGYPTLLGLALAPLAAAAVAALIGVPLLLLRGHHLAFGTLAIHLIFLSLIGEMAITGGDVGLQGIPRLGVGSIGLDSVRGYAYLSCFALAVVIVVSRNVLASRPGRALRALSSSEVAAASSGVPVGRYKLAVFALSAAFAGLAGGVYAFYMGYLAPGSFPVMMSIEYVVMAAVGGAGRISGALAGSAAVFLLVHGLSRLATTSGMPDTAPVILSYAVYASLMVAAVLFLPNGLVALIPMTRGRLRRLARARDSLGVESRSSSPGRSGEKSVAREEHGSLS